MIHKNFLQITVIALLSVGLTISTYFNYLHYKETEETPDFSKKQICANYQSDMRKQIEEFHGVDSSYELREVFYSLTLNSCLYYYVISLGNSNEVYFLKDYLTNKAISQSLPITFEKIFEEQTKFEESLNQYR